MPVTQIDPAPARLLPKRFYAAAAAVPHKEGHALALDGRLARTPARTVLAVRSPATAEAIAAEWAAQADVIDAASMPMTRLANAALDGVASDPAATIDDIVKYAGSDLLCYRAEGPQSLIDAQDAAWNPVLDWAQTALNARFVLAEGLMFVTQPAPALQAVRDEVSGFDDAMALAGLHLMTSLSGSALLALAVAHAALSPQAAWQAAHVDELQQETVWGVDADALSRRAQRERDFMAGAVAVLNR